MKKVILAKYGEIALRGKNRYFFEQRLIDTINNKINNKINNNKEYKVTREQGRILIERFEGDIDTSFVLPKITTILGFVGFSPCFKTENQEISNLQSLALTYMIENFGETNFTFKVETRRAVKNYPLKSNEVSALVGGYVLNNMGCAVVDVHRPQIVLHVELRNDAYVYGATVPGFGGLPVGSSGKGMLLLSGGIDSPVAGFSMAKRGVEIEAVYFHSPPFVSEFAKQKAIDLATRLSDFIGKLPLHIVNFTPIQTYLYERVPAEKLTIFIKRAMLEIAEGIALNTKCQCLITGDAIGQVASQTITSVLAIDSAVTLPILRPLCGFDKLEIIAIAQKIDTYETSIRPYDDCCTLFVAKHPETRPKKSVIEIMEQKMTERKELIRQAILDATVTNL